MPLVLTGPQPTPTEYRPPYVNFPPRATPYSAGPRRFLDQLRFRNLFCHRHDLRQSYISGRLRTHFLLFLRFQMLHLIDILVTSHQKSHSFLGIAVCGVPPPYCTGSNRSPVCSANMWPILLDCGSWCAHLTYFTSLSCRGQSGFMVICGQ